MARELGFEPRTDRLTADSSTAELLPNIEFYLFILTEVLSKIKELYRDNLNNLEQLTMFSSSN